MDNNSKRSMALMRLHSGLPRQGPGSDDTTADALRRLPQIPSPARIYDLGCGPGRASLILANILQQKIIAIDLQEDFLGELRNSAEQKGIAHLIETRCADMASLHDEAGVVDLIWSEGAIYCVGFDAALTAWHPSLSVGGLVACSELSWLTASPSSEPLAFWHENYSGMRSVAENLMAAEQLGFACLDHFTLPERCWWDEYYGPWLRQIEMLKDDAEHDDFLRAAIANAMTEIDLFRQFNHEYGYEFYLLQKSDFTIRRAMHKVK
jgi:SAM-dependent methyltransferase